MSSTEKRRRTILEVIEAAPVRSQAELLAGLDARGIPATQPQLSRDLRALEVVKRDGVYRTSERVTPLDHLSTLLRDVRPAGPYLVCVFTEPGAASAIARALEAGEQAGLVGTVAGDDTVFCAVDSASAGDALRDLIHGFLE